MKTRKHILLGCMALIMAVGFISCSAEDGKDGLNGDPGEPGAVGANGIACWDLNGNGTGEVGAGTDDYTEDTNGDGEVDALDCQGVDGQSGEDGDNCWDRNGNGVGDISKNDEVNEDVNGDGAVDAKDCQGADGEPGADGNANVQKITIDLAPIGNNDTEHTFEVPELTAEFVSTHALLFHLEDTTHDRLLMIPGGTGNIGLDRRYDVQIDPVDQELILLISQFDGNPGGWQDWWEFLHITAIEYSALQNKGNYSDPIKALKAAGVDINDYHAVMQYFGMED